jgi:hypothetical protein
MEARRWSFRVLSRRRKYMRARKQVLKKYILSPVPFGMVSEREMR